MVFVKMDYITQILPIMPYVPQMAITHFRRWHTQMFRSRSWNSLLLCLLIFISYSQALIPDDLIVETTKGKIRGVTLKSATNKEVHAWYGIPYAQPPVGNLRFRHPRHPDAWEGIRETTRLPNCCVQISDTMFPGFPGSEMWNPNTPLSEDCLYLNVVVPATKPKEAAVLVWIFGGGFYSGTSTLSLYDMRVLAAEENIIMVSMQYRVASLGFLYFGTEDVPGNSGLFDQRMALEWIKDNIREFGGNPENVTIFGESAGGASVSYHLLSPLSRNLFSQAIMQSASALVPWGIISTQESTLRGFRLAEAMKCIDSKDVHDKSEIRQAVDCLRTKNATDLVNAEWNGVTVGIAEFPFVPVVDGSFLDETPAKSLQTKNFKKCNILMGGNQDEGYYFIMYYLYDTFKKEENVFVSRKQFEEFVPQLNLWVAPVGQEAIKFEYTDWINPLDERLNRQALDRMVGDYAFTCPVNDFSHRYAETGNNVYVYYFSERASVNPWPTWTGVLHGDEIAFIFGEPLNRSKNYDKMEVELSKRMMGYWANFAKTGNPSMAADGTWSSQYWPLHTPAKREVLVLNAESSSQKEGLAVRKCAFWKNFLPRLLQMTKGSHPCKASCCPNEPDGALSNSQHVLGLWWLMNIIVAAHVFSGAFLSPLSMPLSSTSKPASPGVLSESRKEKLCSYSSAKTASQDFRWSNSFPTETISISSR